MIARVNVDCILLKRRLRCIIHRTLAVDAHERRRHRRISFLVLIRGITQREGTARAGVGRVTCLAVSHRPFVAVVPGLLHGVPHASPPRIVRLLQIQIELVLQRTCDGVSRWSGLNDKGTSPYLVIWQGWCTLLEQLVDAVRIAADGAADADHLAVARAEGTLHDVT